MITKYGKRFLTNYLAGNVDFSSQEIALGIGTTSAQETSTRLDFEFFRIPVQYGTIDIETNTTGSSITARDGVTTIPAGETIYSIIYKATIPQDVAGQITEVGLYPESSLSQNTFSSKYISDFENNLSWTKVSGDGNTNPDLTDPVTNPGTPTPRVGSYLLKIQDTSTSGSTEYKADIATLDISGYGSKDSLTLAYNKADENLSSIRVKFYSSSTDYYYVDFPSTSGTGNKIQSIELSQMQSSGYSAGTEIISIGIAVTATTGTTTVYLDGLRINDEDTFDPVYGMISRSILSPTLSKVAGRAVDIEYRMRLAF